MLKKDENLSLIHFDTLWETMSTVLTERADAEWQHHGDTDAGVAMLQVLAFGASDVAYRHLHSLEDILTLKNAVSGNKNAIDIAREKALTTTPVSADDYRRLILDMVQTDKEQSLEYYLFKNVLVTFDANGDRLCIRLSPEMIIPGPDANADSDIHQKSLIHCVRTSLEANRSHGARPPLVCVAKAKDINVKLEVDLVDDNVDIAKVFAQLYNLLDDWVSPRAKRCLDINRRNAWLTSNGGPKTEHGFVETLPAIEPITSSQNFEKPPKGLVKEIKSIKGIKSIYQIDLTASSILKNSDEDFVLYADYLKSKNGNVFERKANLIRWCGITIRVRQSAQSLTADMIQKEILLLREPKKWIDHVPNKKQNSPAAKYRNVKEWIATWNRLPPSLAANREPSNQHTDMLRQFLSAFDGYFEHVCGRLDKLKTRLHFASMAESNVLGNSQLETVSMSSAESAALNEEDLYEDVFDVGYIQAHLLRYFGFEPAEFSKTRYGLYRANAVAQTNRFIASIADIGRARLSAKGPLTVLQREVAYSLGLYDSAFLTEDLSRWPFYMLDISHLIPKVIKSSGVYIRGLTQCDEHDYYGEVPNIKIHELAVGAIIDVFDGIVELDNATIPRRLAYPGIITSINYDDLVVTVRLFGELPKLGAGSKMSDTVTLKSHLADSAYFPLRNFREQDSKSGKRGIAEVAFGGVYPWLRPGLCVKVHVLDSDGTESAGAVAYGKVTLNNLNGDSTVDFELPTKLDDELYHRLFVSVPGLYDERAKAGQRLAFIFPLYRDVENADFTAWQAKVNFQLKRLVPSHLEFEVYWLKEEAYSAFARKFHNWQKQHKGEPGPEAIRILESLGLARVALPLKGIGTLHIKKEDEVAGNATAAANKWIFYVKQ